MITQSSFESFVQDGGEQSVQLGGGLSLQALQRVHLRLQVAGGWQECIGTPLLRPYSGSRRGGTRA